MGVAETVLDAALENQFGLADRVVDETSLANSVAPLPRAGHRRCRRSPSWPTRRRIAAAIASATPTRRAADPRNLWRVHWYNDLARRPRRRARPRRAAPRAHRRRQPDHRRVRRPLPDDHRAQGARRLRLPGAAGRHRPVRPDAPPGHLAVAPATTPAAASRSAGSWRSRGVAILPAGMSQERFDWLDRWCENPAEDVIRTVGTESQRQGDLRRLQRARARTRRTSCSTSSASSATTSPTTRSPAGRWPHVFEHVAATRGRDLRLAAFTSAPPGSAGTIAAGDRLKEQLRHARRRRRGAGVPDAARERLRRAQHPGHRRQARPADPQRDEHRPRRRRSATGRPTSSR